jgi:hypothetical protein
VVLLDGAPGQLDALRLPTSDRRGEAEFAARARRALVAFQGLAASIDARLVTAAAGLEERRRYESLEVPVLQACFRVGGDPGGP